MRKALAFSVLLCLLATALFAQQAPAPLANKDITDMVQLGLSPDVIVEKIRTAEQTNFDTSLDGLKGLKAANVPDAVMKAMVNPKAFDNNSQEHERS